MESYKRTDLAVESRGTVKNNLDDTAYKEKRLGKITVSELEILTSDSAEKIGKPKGKYVTISCGRFWMLDECERRKVCAIISLEIREMVKAMFNLSEKEPDEHFSVLVAGLGNLEITPDSIGPLTVDKLTVTRHLREHEPKIYKELKSCSISAFSPGVLGKTGIETVELIRGAVENAHPDIVLAVDSLVARNCDRLATTIQLSDTGITPGSGIGNTRKGISAETVGVPVLSVGIPTVVDSSTLVYDTLEKSGIDPNVNELREVLESGKGFFVSPKEIDIIAKKTSDILAEAIGAAFFIC